MERVRYVRITDESLTLPRVVEDMADDVIAFVNTQSYFDVVERAELGERVSQTCRRLYREGIVPASVAMALEKGLYGLIDNGY